MDFISATELHTLMANAVVLFPFPPVDWFLFRVCNVLLKFKKGNIMNNVSACSFCKMFRCHVTSP